jgi:probable H4MPT-linked C1 transfer pathway protein
VKNRLVNVLGFDIGGANTKVSYIKTQNGLITEFKTASQYFPFWKRTNEQLGALLLSSKEQLAGSSTLDCVVVTLTAELSDIFSTKSQGVSQILDQVELIFSHIYTYILDVNGELISIKAAKTNPLSVSAANWAATGWMVAQRISDCIVVDVGSTSTSIIPIVNGKVVANGKTDLEKLINGELVYTGTLRTNVVAVVQTVPVRGVFARVSSELFALTGDVHLILNNISEVDYSVETADGKGKSRHEALARLARVVCADRDMLKEDEIIEIANHIYWKQIEQIACGLNQVCSGLKKTCPVVVTGMGREFLAKKASQKVGFGQILSLEEFMPNQAAFMSPAVGVSLMALARLEAGGVKWKL